MAERQANPRPVRWRWRANPLRRRSDLVEGWVLLITALLMTVGAALAGVLAYQAAQDSARQQREALRPTSAKLLDNAHEMSGGGVYTGDSGQEWAHVQWRSPDGDTHRSTAQVAEGSEAGSHIRIWTNAEGAKVTEPPGPTLMAFQSGVFGVLVAGAWSGTSLVLCWGVRAGLNRQRAAQWERGWAVVEPQWRHRTP
ncbi:hypothetical protein [Streptomyces oceani]|uniref:Integral membrane protein n=1 Tax=Streptomyces oceani TaxID=1075402 RepID=A0A1E7KJB9_9ACTN|nr:hypothetical protein [Streptomyces oceani]OEV03983.1 hypothetical protein AN216_09925 [Streptomyces oceani]